MAQTEDTPMATDQDAGRRLRIVAWVGGGIALPFVLLHGVFSTLMISTFGQMYADMGGPLPAAIQLIFSLGRYGILAVLLLAVDVAIFVGCLRLAKRYWVGLLFAPALIYLGMFVVLLLLLYWPAFNVITLVE